MVAYPLYWFWGAIVFDERLNSTGEDWYELVKACQERLFDVT
jgi:hypothetical protein